MISGSFLCIYTLFLGINMSISLVIREQVSHVFHFIHQLVNKVSFWVRSRYTTSLVLNLDTGHVMNTLSKHFCSI